jgi:hypothetical protein
LSSRVCSGDISRDEAFRELESPTYDAQMQADDCAYVKKKLGLSEHDFTAIMTAPKRRFEQFDSYRRVTDGAGVQLTIRACRFMTRALRVVGARVLE